MIKIAVIQPTLSNYRIPLFTKMSRQKGIELTVFFGVSRKNSDVYNLDLVKGFEYKKVFTLCFKFSWGLKNYFILFHPTIVYYLIKNKYDLVIVAGTVNVLNNIFILSLCKIMKIPFIWWDAGRRLGSKKNIFRKIIDPILNQMARKASACIVYGSAARAYWISTGISPHKIFIANNTIDIDFIDNDIKRLKSQVGQIKKRLKLNDKKILLYVGSIEKRKKIENLVLSYEKLKITFKNLSLIIIGSGPHKRALELFCSEKNIIDVLFLGRVIRDVGLYFMLANIFVLPSEGGLALNQAMAYGKPVIATSADGTEIDLIKYGINGFIVKEDDVDSLSDAIRKILSDKRMEKSMGIESGRLIKSKFTLDNMIKRMNKAIKYAITNQIFLI
jgi:glycosyltransferase involved in cell wall biosynthesis